MEPDKAIYNITTPDRASFNVTTPDKETFHSRHASSEHINPNGIPLRPLKHDSTALDGAAPVADVHSDAKPEEEGNTHYLTGWKLFLALTSITLVMLLAMLDLAIIGTVGLHLERVYGLKKLT